MVQDSAVDLSGDISAGCGDGGDDGDGNGDGGRESLPSLPPHELLWNDEALLRR